MYVLVACEESQAVTKRFREKGHIAYSCDVVPCTGGHPEWHLQQDVTALFDEDWDMIIAFPPCTHLASSGARWFKEKQADGRQQEAIEFFMLFTRAMCNRIAIENPVGIMSKIFRQPNQIIQPWEYGHGETKATCLWLIGLRELRPTNIVEGREARIHHLPPTEDRAALRSKTYPGIADAMAEQWGG